MTLPASYRNDRVGDGTTTIFPYTFKIWSAEEMLVVLTDPITGAVTKPTSGFSVTGVGSDGGNVVFDTAPADDTAIVFLPTTTYEQSTDLVNETQFFQERMEDGLDKICRQAQLLKESQVRGLRLPDSEIGTDLLTTLPPLDERKGKQWTWDPVTGQPRASSPSSAPVSTAMEPVVASATLDAAADALPFTATGATTARSARARAAESLSPLDFDAIGNGIADDTAAVQAAITAAAGKVLDGLGRTYKVTAPLTGVASNTIIRNATFNFSAMPAQVGTDKCIAFSGAIGSPIALTANLTAGSATVTVGSTAGFIADQLVWLASTAVWDSTTSTIYGIYARIKSVDSPTQMTLYANSLLDFTTATSATVAAVTMVKAVRLENVKIIGAQANQQIGVYAEYCEDLTIIGCRFESIDYAATALWRCVSSQIIDCRARFARDSGAAYAFAIWGGCYGCSVADSWGYDCRHTVTVGDNDGINLFTWAVNCHAIDSKDAGFDSHSASIYTTFIGCHVQMSAAQAGSSNHDGIIIQGANGKVIGCTIVGARGSGIVYQPYFQSGFRTSFDAVDNTVDMAATGLGSSSSRGINVQNITNCADIESVTLSNNRCSGGASNANGHYHVYIQVNKVGGVVKKVLIDKLTALEAAVTNSVLVHTSGASAAVQKCTISDSHLWTSGQRAVYFLAEGAGSNIDRPAVYNSTLNGGFSYGVDFSGTGGTITNAREAWNTWENITTRRHVTNGTGSRFDLSEDAPVTVGGASTYAVTDSDFSIIANRAGTITVTLPAAASWSGRVLEFKTIQAQAVDSASSNVVPINDSAAGTSILPATDGSWCRLKSDGTNWVTIARG